MKCNFLVFCTALLLGASIASWASDDGAALYKKKCAGCHGASGEGKTESSAASPQEPDAASAGRSIVAKRNTAVAATANRLARSIFDNPSGGTRKPHAALPCGPDRRISELTQISQQI